MLPQRQQHRCPLQSGDLLEACVAGANRSIVTVSEATNFRGVARLPAGLLNAPQRLALSLDPVGARTPTPSPRSNSTSPVMARRPKGLIQLNLCKGPSCKSPTRVSALQNATQQRCFSRPTPSLPRANRAVRERVTQIGGFIKTHGVNMILR